MGSEKNNIEYMSLISEIVKKELNDISKIRHKFCNANRVSIIEELEYGKYYILEVNYFPSYRELGDKIVEYFAQPVVVIPTILYPEISCASSINSIL